MRVGKKEYSMEKDEVDASFGKKGVISVSVRTLLGEQKL